VTIPILLPSQANLLEALKPRLQLLLGSDLLQFKLFGSRARGDAGPDSDLDVILVVRNLTRERRDEILSLVAEQELALLTPVSLLLMSEPDFERLRSLERRLALDVEAEGIDL
jgi:predicted nucleotidyltransferase